jgi:hypothetical protein
MTEVEATKLLSDLSAVATQLNKQSDSINEILGAWEQKLRALNIGLDVWVTLSTEEASVTVEDDSPAADPSATKDVHGSLDHQLGWDKYIDNTWRLLTRQVTYRLDLLERQEIWRSEMPQPIRSASRKVRIDALEALPRLLQQLKKDAEEAVGKIERAKTLVK